MSYESTVIESVLSSAINQTWYAGIFISSSFCVHCYMILRAYCSHFPVQGTLLIAHRHLILHLILSLSIYYESRYK